MLAKILTQMKIHLNSERKKKNCNFFIQLESKRFTLDRMPRSRCIVRWDIIWCYENMVNENSHSFGWSYVCFINAIHLRFHVWERKRKIKILRETKTQPGVFCLFVVVVVVSFIFGFICAKKTEPSPRLYKEWIFFIHS